MFQLQSYLSCLVEWFSWFSWFSWLTDKTDRTDVTRVNMTCRIMNPHLVSCELWTIIFIMLILSSRWQEAMANLVTPHNIKGEKATLHLLVRPGHCRISLALLHYVTNNLHEQLTSHSSLQTFLLQAQTPHSPESKWIPCSPPRKIRELAPTRRCRDYRL